MGGMLSLKDEEAMGDCVDDDELVVLGDGEALPDGDTEAT